MVIQPKVIKIPLTSQMGSQAPIALKPISTHQRRAHWKEISLERHPKYYTHTSKSLAMWTKWFQAKYACSKILAKVGSDIQFLEKVQGKPVIKPYSLFLLLT